MIYLYWCANCYRLVETNQHGYCEKCGSAQVVYHDAQSEERYNYKRSGHEP